MYTPLTIKSALKMPFCFLQDIIYDKISKVSLSQELYVIVNWNYMSKLPKDSFSISVLTQYVHEGPKEMG